LPPEPAAPAATHSPAPANPPASNPPAAAQPGAVESAPESENKKRFTKSYG